MFMEKMYLLKIYVTDRGKLAKTIFALKIAAANGILRQERGGLAMPLTSQELSPPFHTSPLPKWPVWRVDGARLGPNPLAKNSERHFRIKY